MDLVYGAVDALLVRLVQVVVTRVAAVFADMLDAFHPHILADVAQSHPDAGCSEQVRAAAANNAGPAGNDGNSVLQIRPESHPISPHQ